MSKPDDTSKTGIEERAKALFDESVDALDGATLSKLNRSRQLALAELADTPSRQWVRWAPVTGAAAAALVVAIALRGPGGIDVPEGQVSSVTDFEILLSDDDLDMLEELEFYSWLDTADLDAVTNGG